MSGLTSQVPLVHFITRGKWFGCSRITRMSSISSRMAPPERKETKMRTAPGIKFLTLSRDIFIPKSNCKLQHFAHVSQQWKLFTFHSNSDKRTCRTSDLMYAIEDVPPWYTAVFLGMQGSSSALL